MDLKSVSAILFSKRSWNMSVVVRAPATSTRYTREQLLAVKLMPSTRSITERELQ